MNCSARQRYLSIDRYFQIHCRFSHLALAISLGIFLESGVEPEIDFPPVKKRRYEKYSSELCVFCHKSESVDSLERGLSKVYIV